jgi:hypothetical protein
MYYLDVYYYYYHFYDCVRCSLTGALIHKYIYILKSHRIMLHNTIRSKIVLLINNTFNLASYNSFRFTIYKNCEFQT